MPDAESDALNAYLLNLYGGDPFANVYAACEPHRLSHAASLAGGEQECGVYPSVPEKARVLATLVRATGARRLLEIGCGLGYSALWLGEAAPAHATIETIDRFPEHVALAEGFAKSFGLADRISVIEGEGDEVLQRLSGPYDIIHDDGWFGQQPAYYDRIVELLRPGGLLILSNWFLLGETFSAQPRMDWSQFAGPDWAANIRSYAANLASDPRLYLSFIMQPSWVGLACKRLDA